jgi:hypothetical protein
LFTGLTIGAGASRCAPPFAVPTLVVSLTKVTQHFIQVMHGERQSVVFAFRVGHELSSNRTHAHTVLQIDFEVAKGFRVQLFT